ncbi:MAG: HU family DNA-binding protein [Planctomycetes bacterium]|nr:HU family DNA-binding protein [Planctomycetota bacterium]
MVLRIAKEMGMRQTDIKRIVQMTLDGIIDVLADKQRLELRNFGVFEVRTRKPRKARNPRTGQEVMVPQRKVVTFKPGKLMEERIYNEKTGDAAAPAPAPMNSEDSSDDSDI